MEKIMRYRLLFMLLVPTLGLAQTTLTGLDKYRIGYTTPDSLPQTLFLEESQPLVKGTIALTCDHIRLFTAAAVTTKGIAVKNLVLAFYDDTLFRISCDYSDSLKEMFQRQHGLGVQQPERRLNLCVARPDQLLTVQDVVWTSGDVRAVSVRMTGYSADCQPLASARLTIVSQRFVALSSDCDLPADIYADRFLNRPE